MNRETRFAPQGHANAAMPRPFTLIELLVVIGVIAILAGFMLPAMSTARDRARRVNCMANLKHIGITLRMYAAGHDGHFPPGDNADGLNVLFTSGYMTDNTLCLCPSTLTVPATGGMIDNWHLDYIYRGGLTEKSCGQETGLGCDRIVTPNHNNYGSVLYGDGHVVGYSGEDWSTINNTHNTGGWPADPH
jgi:prepilin-type N-terminal cleavage/methylation domain-containing protein